MLATTSCERRVLITGGTGLLGATLLHDWQRSWKLSAVARRHRFEHANIDMVTADLTRLDDCASLLDRAAPDCVVHTAAITNVDRCEREPALARALHRDATARLARAAHRRKARFVYISTDALFGGREHVLHRESDPVDPTSVYGRTKLEGEEVALEETAGEALIVRTCIYGWNAEPKLSLAEWMLGELRAGRAITGFRDVFFTPILCNTLGHALRTLIERAATGIVHVGSADVVSKYGFACLLARQFGLAEELVRAGTIVDSPLAAARPRHPCLDSSRYRELSQERAPYVADDVARLWQLEAAGYPASLRALVSRADEPSPESAAVTVEPAPHEERA